MLSTKPANPLSGFQTGESTGFSRRCPQDTPVLRQVFSNPKSRDGSSKKLHKTFVGGAISLVGSEAPAGLSGRPIRVLLMDEVDRFADSAGGEGNPASIAEKRVSTFWNSKVILTASPTNEGFSEISKAYAESTMEQWWIDCPGCGYSQVLAWERLKFRTLHHHCIKCEQGFSQADWSRSSRLTGTWIPRRTHDEHGREINTRGFNYSCIINPRVPWSKLVDEFCIAVKKLKEGDSEDMKVFENTRLAKTFEPSGLQVEEDALMRRREYYGKCEVPDRAVVLTGSVDVQRDRLEYSVWGWGAGHEVWLIEYGKIWGDPLTDEPWRKLDELLCNREFKYEDGFGIKCHRIFIDSGFLPDSVHKFINRRWPRIYATKGIAGYGRPMVSHQSSEGVGVSKSQLLLLGVDSIKDELITRLNVEEHGPGFVHFPAGIDREEVKGVDLEFFKALCAERKITVTKHGKRKSEWRVLSGRRNEPWDLFCYARAAIEYGNVDLSMERPRASDEPPKPIKFGVYDPTKNPTPQQLSPTRTESTQQAGTQVPRWMNNGSRQSAARDPHDPRNW